MKKIMLMAMLPALAACSTQEEAQDLFGGRVPVSLSSSAVTATITRGGAAQNLNNTNIASGGKVCVQISNHGANDYTPYVFTTGASGAMTADGSKPYYPTDDTNIDIAAYYPNNGTFSGDNFVVQTDQSTDENYKLSDLMFASVANQAKTTESVNLAFSHKMAKIVVNATAGDDVNAIQTITLKSVYPQASFNKTTGVTGDGTGAATDITLFTDGTNTTANCAGVIPSQTKSGALLEIVTDQGTATYSLSSDKAFLQGYQYVMNIQVNKTEVGTTTSITDWTGTGNVYIGGAGESVSLTSGTLALTYGGSALTTTASVTTGESVTYTVKSSDESVATALVNSTTGEVTVTPVNAGTATVAVIAIGTQTQYTSALCQVTVNKAAAPTPTLSATSLTVNGLGSTNTFTVSRSGNGEVTAESSATDKATVVVTNATAATATVTVTGVAAGEATITVKVNEGTNYEAYTAADKTVTVTVTEDPGLALDNSSIANGWFIGANGKAYSTAALADQYSNPIAIVVWKGSDSDLTCGKLHGLAMALGEPSGSGSSSAWGGYGTDESYLTNCSSIDNCKSNNKNGLTNTTSLVSCGVSGHDHTAAKLATNYTPAVPASGTTAWFLPSAAQWFKAAEGLGGYTGSYSWAAWEGSASAKAIIGNFNNAIGDNGTKLTDGASYWSSSEYNNGSAVFVSFNSSNGVTVGNGNKNYSGRVRPFLAF
ncbi:MAG: fimbrillin family protein [Prevotella sp.]|nr:fimbrillin family protein [Prevotella sp.]